MLGQCVNHYPMGHCVNTMRSKGLIFYDNKGIILMSFPFPSTSWSCVGLQPVTELMHRDKLLHTNKPKPKHVYGRKPQYPNATFTDAGRTHKLHQVGFQSKTFQPWGDGAPLSCLIPMWELRNIQNRMRNYEKIIYFAVVTIQYSL